MATAKSILVELAQKGNPKTQQIYARHGMPAERVYGVSVADLKVIAKAIKGEQALALEVYKSGVMDAMYLAGLISHRFPLKQAVEAIRLAANPQPDSMKIVLQPRG